MHGQVFIMLSTREEPHCKCHRKQIGLQLESIIQSVDENTSNCTRDNEYNHLTQKVNSQIKLSSSSFQQNGWFFHPTQFATTHGALRKVYQPV